jgi:hypothetical protein
MFQTSIPSPGFVSSHPVVSSFQLCERSRRTSQILPRRLTVVAASVSFGQFDDDQKRINSLEMISASEHQVRFYDELTTEEQQGYERLRESLAEPLYKGRRHQSTESFRQVLELLKGYVGDSKIRALVCGIIWLDHGLGINTHQLSRVSNRSKSSINGSMQALGYGTVPSGADVAPQFEKLFPALRGDYAQLRQWTIRRRTDEVPPIPTSPREEESSELDPSLLNDECVAAYLNDECTLAQMVQTLLQNQGKVPLRPRGVLAVPDEPGFPWGRPMDGDQDDREGISGSPWI